ncbi:MAG: hypothetical protein WC385_02450 [Candidatus Paceibacterota bacterium]|jgi:hypothetical protein
MDQKQWLRESTENYETIRQEITILSKLFDERKFKDFWQKVREVRDLFKNLKPLERSAREELWAEFSELCSTAKKQSEERASRSELLKNQILADIVCLTGTDNMLIWNPFDVDEVEEACQINETIRRARENLSTILEKMKSLRGKLTKEDNQACWDKWKAASDRLNNLYQDLCNSCYYRIERDIRETWKMADFGDNPYQVLEEVKQHQGRVREALLTRDQRQEFRNNLNTIWEKAISQIEAQREERRERNEAWREKTEAWITHQQEIIEKGQEFIEKLQNEIDDLRERISSSHNDNFIERAEGWITEKEEKILETENRNREIEDNIRENQEKLDGDKFRR